MAREEKRQRRTNLILLAISAIFFIRSGQVINQPKGAHINFSVQYDVNRLINLLINQVLFFKLQTWFSYFSVITLEGKASTKGSVRD